jgi:hypothetical protein
VAREFETGIETFAVIAHPQCEHPGIDFEL